MKDNASTDLYEIVLPVSGSAKTHFDTSLDVETMSVPSTLIIKGWVGQLSRREHHGLAAMSSLLSADQSIESWDEGPSSDPNYSEYWAEAIPAPSQPEEQPSSEQVSSSASLRALLQTTQGTPRSVMGQNTGWSEEQWTEITPSWVESYPDNPPSSDPPEPSSDATFAGRFARILNQVTEGR